MLEKLKSNYPDITFSLGDRYSWNHAEKVITYANAEDENLTNHSLVHELSHAILKHSHFKNDIELLKMERDAWALTKKLLKEFGDMVDIDHIEDCLDTYRDWIYSRAKCPSCSLVGFQSSKNSYSCVFCVQSWNLPDSRLCIVKRVLDPIARL